VEAQEYFGNYYELDVLIMQSYSIKQELGKLEHCLPVIGAVVKCTVFKGGRTR